MNTKEFVDIEEWKEKFNKEKEEYDDRDYVDCNIRIKLTIDVEACRELKELLYSKEGKIACASRVFNQGYSTELNNILEKYSEGVVPRSFSVIDLEDSKFEKYNY